MSETPQSPTPAEPEPEREPEARSDDEAGVALRDVLDPGTVRRAPRYKAFFLTGAVVGLVAGVGLSVYLVGTPAAQGMMKPGVYATVLTAFVMTATTLLAGLVAVVADRWSLRRR